MSRIGKRPVPLPQGVTATTEGQILSVKGPKGTLDLQMREEIAYDIGDDGIHVKPANDTKQARAFWGMQRTLVSNLVEGVTDGEAGKWAWVVGQRVEQGRVHVDVLEVPATGGLAGWVAWAPAGAVGSRRRCRSGLAAG